MSVQPEQGAVANFVNLKNLIPSAAAVECLAETSARRLNVVPVALWIKQDQQQLVIACENPSDTTLKERLSKHIPKNIHPILVRSRVTDIGPAIVKCYQRSDSFQHMISVCNTVDRTEQNLAQQPDFLIRLIELLLVEASRLGASDIHVSPDDEVLYFRFRIDGVLKAVGHCHLSLLNPLLVRIKVMATLDIAETRHPQDGQFSQLIEGHIVDFRVSTFPTVQGENTVLRVLREQSMLNTLNSLALPQTVHRQLSELVRRPDGLILICGPTGAGKSTTLYALINELDRDELNIMTLEDPVERSVFGIRQTNIDADRQLDYGRGVRALLRQDPDVLLIGEIRDSQSCSMSLRAVTTGHLVLTTVHARSVFGALTRLRELGAQGSVLASNLLAVASQRLVRTRCCRCSGSNNACVHCYGIGFQGRKILLELLVVTPELVALIATDAPLAEIEMLAVSSGFVSMREQAYLLVDSGITTEDEVDRVLGRQ